MGGGGAESWQRGGGLYFIVILTIRQATPMPAPPMIAAWSLTNFSVTSKQPEMKIFPGTSKQLPKDYKK